MITASIMRENCAREGGYATPGHHFSPILDPGALTTLIDRRQLVPPLIAALVIPPTSGAPGCRPNKRRSVQQWRARTGGRVP